MKKLEVLKVRYFETRRGLGYECKTNHKDVTIWNDGLGGGTYIQGFFPAILSEGDLEIIISRYEKV